MNREGKEIMAKETDENFEYISNQRYIIEIKVQETGKVYYTKRIGTLPAAVDIAADYNMIADLAAVIMDTKTGEFL